MGVGALVVEPSFLRWPAEQELPFPKIMMNALLVWPVAARRTVAAFRSTFQSALALIALAVAPQTWAAIEPSPANEGYATASQPGIVAGPEDVVATFGTDVTFSVVASGSGVAYQWRRNGVAIAGATDASLTLTAVDFTAADRYDVVVLDAVGSDPVVSAAAQLNVLPAQLPGHVTPDLDWRVELRGGLSGVTQLIAAPGGGALVIGRFAELNGHATRNLAKIGADGAVDLDFAAPELEHHALSHSGASPRWQGDKIIVLATAKPFGEAQGAKLLRLNGHGAVDATFAFSTVSLEHAEFLTVAQFELDGLGRIYVRYSIWDPATQYSARGILRLGPDGAVDEDFGPLVLGGGVSNMLVRQDGRVLVWGRRLTVDGQAVDDLVQFTTDGDLDATFAVRPEFEAYIGDPSTIVAENPSGGLVVSTQTTVPVDGAYRHLMRWDERGSETFRWNLANLETTGENPPDIGFNAFLTDLSDLRVQVDGSLILIGASMDGVTDHPRGILARAHLDGGVEVLEAAVFNSWRPSLLSQFPGNESIYVTSFISGSGPILSGTNPPAKPQRFNAVNGAFNADLGLSTLGEGVVHGLLPLADGSWLVAGDFHEVNGTTSHYLVQLDALGDVVRSFLPEQAPDGAVRRLQRWGGAAILIEGDFDTFAGNPANGLAKLSLSFEPVEGFALDDEFGPGERISFPLPGDALLVSGWWLTSGATGHLTRRIALLDETGAIDNRYSFTATDGPLEGAVVLPDGSIVMGGFPAGGGKNLLRWTTAGGFDPVFASNAADVGTVIALARGVGGRTWVAEFQRFYPVLDDGRPDPVFSSDVYSIFRYGLSHTETGTLLSPTPDGGILVGGLQQRMKLNGKAVEGAVVRITAVGQEDKNFSLAQVADPVTAMHLTSDGQLLLGVPGALVKTINQAEVYPQILASPAAAVVIAGENVTLTVAATGPDLKYQWRRDGSALQAETGASLMLANVSAADVGRYSVEVSNRYGTVLSAAAIVTVTTGDSPVMATHAAVRQGYQPGGTVVVENTVSYAGSLDSLRWQVLLPEGWRFRVGNASGTAQEPAFGDELLAVWEWTSVPASPFTFRYALDVPSGARGDRDLVALVEAGHSGSTSLGLAEPDPLILQRVRFHSADSDGDNQIDLSELLRVIELYNTRFGTNRTGRYGDNPESSDGFATAPDGNDEGVAGRWRFHAADVDRNGRLDLSELLRVIELYNTRSGTVRTGRYHTAEGTVDGFVADPDSSE